jgi:HAD superfamily hydrolase (TIGR01450 family)
VDLVDECWLFDLDGVVWLADQPIPGAAEAVAELVAHGRRVAYFTNNSRPRRRDHLDKLHRFGLPADDADLLTSPEAAAALCASGERALVLGGAGIVEALEQVGVTAVDAGSAGPDEAFDVVVVGIDLELSYPRLDAAVRAIRGGARFLATNDDATFPTPTGPGPGAGAIVAAVATATGVAPVVAGKPHPPAAALARRRLDGLRAVVGDRPSTDGALARALGVEFALVLSGVTRPGHGPLDPEPDIEAADVAALVDRLLRR